jgi:hypothetical protein
MVLRVINTVVASSLVNSFVWSKKMNMISTGAFLTDEDASNKQDTLVSKLVSVWEKKNSKTARAGGVSLMALSLAACGSSDDTATDATTFTQAQLDLAVSNGKTAALTGANGTVYATVDAAVTSNDTAIAGAVDKTTNDAAAILAAVQAVDATATSVAAVKANATTAAEEAAVVTTGSGAADNIVGTSSDESWTFNVLQNPANGTFTVESLTAIDTVDGGAGNDEVTY